MQQIKRVWYVLLFVLCSCASQLNTHDAQAQDKQSDAQQDVIQKIAFCEKIPYLYISSDFEASKPHQKFLDHIDVNRKNVMIKIYHKKLQSFKSRINSGTFKQTVYEAIEEVLEGQTQKEARKLFNQINIALNLGLASDYHMFRNLYNYQAIKSKSESNLWGIIRQVDLSHRIDSDEYGELYIDRNDLQSPLEIIWLSTKSTKQSKLRYVMVNGYLNQQAIFRMTLRYDESKVKDSVSDMIKLIFAKPK